MCLSILLSDISVITEIVYHDIQFGKRFFARHESNAPDISPQPTESRRYSHANGEKTCAAMLEKGKAGLSSGLSHTFYNENLNFFDAAEHRQHVNILHQTVSPASHQYWGQGAPVLIPDLNPCLNLFLKAKRLRQGIKIQD